MPHQPSPSFCPAPPPPPPLPGSNTNLFMLDGEDDEGASDTEVGRPLLDASEVAGAADTSAGLDGAAPGALTATRGEGRGGGAAAAGGAIEDYSPVTYNYAFFHLIFALASMYIAMLLTGWGVAEQEKDRLDVGWTSVWVKVAAQWATGGLYCWTLLAPALFPDREFA